jgi:hypothetical protein
VRGKQFTLYGYRGGEHWFWDTGLFDLAMLWPLWLFVAVIIALAVRG